MHTEADTVPHLQICWLSFVYLHLQSLTAQLHQFNSFSLLLLFVVQPFNCLSNIDLSHAKYMHLSLCLYTAWVLNGHNYYIALSLNIKWSQSVVCSLENDILAKQLPGHLRYLSIVTAKKPSTFLPTFIGLYLTPITSIWRASCS